MKNKMQVDFAQFEYTLSILGECTDDYMYILDFSNNHFAISKSALEIFALEESHFFDALEVLKQVIYQDDYEAVIHDIYAIKSQEKTNQNIECRWIDKKGNAVWIQCKGYAVTGENEIPQYLVGRICELGKQSRIDNVTSLYRENVFQTQYVKMSEKTPFSGFMMAIGIDNFKEVNEKYGMQFGNMILSNVSECIKQSIHLDVNLFRLDGDEFILFCAHDNYNKEDGVKELYKQIRRKVDKSIEEYGYQIFYTISAGIYYVDSRYDDYDAAMRSVRFALHNAKLNGKNAYVEYDEDRYVKYIRKLDIQDCLRKSIQNGYEGFELYYQPIINVREKNIRGAEALVRWNSERYGFMSPVEFVPLLEESSLIIPLGKWIIETAAKQCKEWKKAFPDFRMNINLSFVQLQKSDVVKDALECIDNLEMPHKNFVFEVTESGQLGSSQVMKNVLKTFSDKDIELAIDDFGTGYSNFSYIKDMMFNLIKVDRIFIKNILHNEYDYRLVKHITDMAHSLNLKVCYEGVETKEELEMVSSLNPDCIQGYVFGKPINSCEFEGKFLQFHQFV